MRWFPLALALPLAAVVASAGPHTAHAEGGTVAILVLREQAVGTAAQAQPYVDKFVAMAAKKNGWAGGKGQFHTTRSAAEAFIQSDKPSFGIVSLPAFLALRGKHNLEVIGQVEMATAAGREYHLISKTATDLAGCKGKTLATNHGDDARFVDHVIAGGAFKLADFTVVPTTRPVQTIKKVSSGDAVCALVDDAQVEELTRLEDARSVRSVWKSARLPPMVVAAFPGASAAEKKAFQASLPGLCAAEGKSICAEVGISALKGAGPGDYASVVGAYK